MVQIYGNMSRHLRLLFLFLTTLAAVSLDLACNDAERDGDPSASASVSLSSTQPSGTPAPTSPTLEPSEEWLDYEDPEGIYILRYPAKLNPEFRSSGQTYSTRFSGDGSNAGFVISVQDAAGLSLEDWFAEFNACVAGASREARQIAGEQALTCTANVLGDALEDTAAIKYQEKIIYISSTLAGEDFDSVLESLELLAV